MVRKIGMLSMKDSSIPSRYNELNMGKNEISVGKGSKKRKK